MKGLKIIENVDRFSASDKFVCLVKNDILEVLGFQDVDKRQVFNFKERMEFVYTNEKYIWVNSNSGIGFYIVDGQLFSRGNYILTIDRNSMLYELSNEGISQIDLLTLKRNWMIPVSSLLTRVEGGEIYVRTKATEVSAFSVETGEKKWSYYYNEDFDYFTNLSISKKKKATVSRIIGHHNGILWIALNSGRLLGIDNTTAKLKHNICNPNHAPGDFQIRRSDEYLHYGLYMNLDESRNMLFGLRGQYYFEIDLSSPDTSYSIYEIQLQLNKYGFGEVNVSGNGYENVWNQSKIFFGERDTSGPSIGEFNRITKQVTWSAKGLDSNSYLPNIQSMQYTNNRLFALDGMKRLHVFQDHG